MDTVEIKVQVEITKRKRKIHKNPVVLGVGHRYCIDIDPSS